MWSWWASDFQPSIRVVFYIYVTRHWPQHCADGTSRYQLTLVGVQWALRALQAKCGAAGPGARNLKLWRTSSECFQNSARESARAARPLTTAMMRSTRRQCCFRASDAINLTTKNVARASPQSSDDRRRVAQTIVIGHRQLYRVSAAIQKVSVCRCCEAVRRRSIQGPSSSVGWGAHLLFRKQSARADR